MVLLPPTPVREVVGVLGRVREFGRPGVMGARGREGVDGWDIVMDGWMGWI
jgi:hypothetical protein